MRPQKVRRLILNIKRKMKYHFGLLNEYEAFQRLNSLLSGSGYGELFSNRIGRNNHRTLRPMFLYKMVSHQAH